MTDYSPRRIPEWLNLEDIARAWSEETGERAAELERRFRDWYREFLVRNAYVETGGGDDEDALSDLLVSQQVWRETFETFCEERGYEKPRFWFPDRPTGSSGGQGPRPGRRLRFGRSEPAAPEAPEVPDREDALSAAPDGEATLPEETPPRRPPRKGLRAFTGIAAALVLLIVLGLGGFWYLDSPGQVVWSGAKDLFEPERLASLMPTSEPRSAETGAAATEQGAEQASNTADGGAATGEPALAAGNEPAAEEPAAEEPAAEVVSAADAPVVPRPKPVRLEAVPASQHSVMIAVPAEESSVDATAGDASATAQVSAVATGSTAAVDAEDDLIGGPHGLVFLIQRELKLAGFDPGPQDGLTGRKLSGAIAGYQRARGLEVDGQADANLLWRLAQENFDRGRTRSSMPQPIAVVGKLPEPRLGVSKVEPSPLAPVSKPGAAPRGRALVRAVQERLAARHYYTGPLDGNVGPKMREAIETYQRAHRQAITGKPSRELYEELEDYALELNGLRQFRAGNYERAAQFYERIIKRQPRNANAYFNRGLCYRNAGRLEQALADYEEALRLDPDHNKAFMDRANVFYRQGYYREALRDYVKVIGLWLDLT